MRFGQLSESQVKDIERILADTSSLNLPQWAFNRKRDPETGETKQLIGSDLDLALKSDVERERNIQSWKGVRHSLGLKVRGSAPHHGEEGEDGRCAGRRHCSRRPGGQDRRREEVKNRRRYTNHG